MRVASVCLLLLGGAAVLVSRVAYSNGGISTVGVSELPLTKLGEMGRQPFSPSDLEKARQNGLKHDDLPSLGSGLARIGLNEFVGISDRGPNGEVNGRRTFPLPRFCPFITRFRIAEGKIEILNTILIRDAQGHPITGLSNGEGEERLFESADACAPLPFDPNGIDPEAIRVLPDGKFLVSEEYGPSILVVNTNGQVLVRYTPETKPLQGAAYPVKPLLPAVFKQRRTNRGFEALALSRDGRVAYAMLQSPMGDEADPKFRDARISRVVQLDLSDPLNARVVAQYLMPLSHATDYGTNQRQARVKLNDAEWVGPNKLLVLEQAGDSARLMVADFVAATNLEANADRVTLKFEAVGNDLSKLGVTPASVTVWATIPELGPFATKLEGLAILSPTEVAVSNDNDFGIGESGNGVRSTVWTLKLSRPLPLAP